MSNRGYQPISQTVQEEEEEEDVGESLPLPATRGLRRVGKPAIDLSKLDNAFKR